MVYIKKCCCGCNLATGVEILAWSEMFINIFAVILLASHLTEVQQDGTKTDHLTGFLVNRIITMFAAVFLSLGVNHWKKILLLPYLIIQVVTAFLVAFVFVVSVFKWIGTITIIWQGLSLAFLIYVSLVVFSLYQEMMGNDERKRENSDPPLEIESTKQPLDISVL